MRTKFREFIPLLSFLLLGLVLLALLFPEVSSELTGGERYTVEDWDISNQIRVDDKSGKTIIRPILPSHSLEYSTDGGAHFYDAPAGGISPSELRSADLIYRSTSIRWKHPEGVFQKVPHLVLRIRDSKKMKRSTPLVYTDVSTIKSTLPIVHLSCSEDDLFGWKEGIMNLGAASANDSGFYKAWWYRSANFAARGSSAARKAYFQYFEDGALMVEQDVTIKISGNATRYFPQKSIKLYPLESNGRDGKMKYRFWGKSGAKKSTSFLLRQSGNDNTRTLFADLLMHTLADSTHVIVQHGFPVNVYLNGNYWGIYNLRERIDRYMISKREGADKKKDITILYCEVYGDRTQLKKGKNSEKEAFDELMTSLPEETLSDEAYEMLAEEMSMTSFMDYIIFETYYANQDWLYNNTTWYREKKKKWKWILNDLDYSLAYPGVYNIRSNRFDELLKANSITGRLFSALISNAAFKTEFKERVDEILTTRLSESNIEKTAKELQDRYAPEMDQQIRRWRGIESIQQWEKDCQENVNFLQERRIIYQKQVEGL